MSAQRDNLREIKRLKNQISDQKREIKEQRREIDFLFDCEYESNYDHRKWMGRLITCLCIVTGVSAYRYVYL